MRAQPSNCPCVRDDGQPPAYRDETGETEIIRFEATVCVRCGTMIQSRIEVKDEAVEADDPTELDWGPEVVPIDVTGQRDTCPACGEEVESDYREFGVVAGCENDDCRVEGFLPWVGDEDG